MGVLTAVSSTPLLVRLLHVRLFRSWYHRGITMLFIKCILPLALLLAATPPQKKTNDPPSDFATVCEVLANRGAYDGKVVALIGRRSSTDEGFWLASDCENSVK